MNTCGSPIARPLHCKHVFHMSRRPGRRMMLHSSRDDDVYVSRIYEALKLQYGETSAKRVLQSLSFAAVGQEYTRFHPDKGLQKASSYITGLSAEPFHDVSSPHFTWMMRLEEEYSIIRDELNSALLNPRLTTLGNHIWASAAREEAIAYGPDWKTLVLQDRCVWEDTNCKLFPKTVELLRKNSVPSVEVFFARQAPDTGIKPHTDNTNFILTSHLGLDVPEGECWMKVGEFKREWMNGRGMIADTSFIHSTANESRTQTRYVLIVRFWHPDLTPEECCALQFLFDALNESSEDGIANAMKLATKRQGKSKPVLGKASKKREKAGGLGLLAKGMK